MEGPNNEGKGTLSLEPFMSFWNTEDVSVSREEERSSCNLE